MRESHIRLVRQAIDGNKRAFATLYRMNRPSVVRFATRLVGSRALDVAQESFLEAYLSLSTLRFPDRFRSWLFAIVLNVSRRLIRSDATEASAVSRLSGGWLESSPMHGPEEALVIDYEATRVRDAIQSLPPALREAVELYYLQMLPVREAASALGIGTSALKTRLHRARVKLIYGLGKKEEPEVTEARRVHVLDVLGDGVVLFVDWEGQKVFPVFMSRDQVQSIAMGMKNVDIGRPMTFQFVATLLRELGGKVESVLISALDDTGTFLARLRLNNGKEIDARPSDAVNLAIIVGAPLFADGELIDRIGTHVDVDPDKRELYKEKGITDIADAVRSRALSRMQQEGLKRYVQSLFTEAPEE